MNKDFLHYYSSELDYLRKEGRRFAEENPKIAERLDINSIPCGDPYIERLLEGFAFLTSRINYKYDAGYPRFSQALLNNMFPQFLNPVPSVAVTSFIPDYYNKNLAEGFCIPRNTVLRSKSGINTNSCQFRTVYDIKLWPMKILRTEYQDYISGLDSFCRGDSEFNVEMECTAGLNFCDLQLDKVDYYLSSADLKSSASLFELICTACSKIVILYSDNNGKKKHILINEADEMIEHIGFSKAESLFPLNNRTAEAQRILREYCIFPQKFMFLRINKLKNYLKEISTDKITFKFIFDRKSECLRYLNSNILYLHCSPIVNYFPKTLTRIHLDRGKHEFHVVGERTAPLDYEISEIISATGFGSISREGRKFYPLYNSSDFFSRQNTISGYFTTNRTKRKLTKEELENGTRSTYSGTELFISLVDHAGAPYDNNLSELEIKAYCSNRDLPLTIPLGIGNTDFYSDSNIFASSIHCIEKPTSPYMGHIFGSLWDTVNQISHNYSLLTCKTPEETAEKLRDTIKLFSISSNNRKVVKALDEIRISKKLCRCREEGFHTIINGLKVETVFTEDNGHNPEIYLLGAVLNKYFKSIAPVNLFITTELISTLIGSVKQWQMSTGISQII